MAEFTQAVTLFTSQDGDIFTPLKGIEMCKNCGKKTLVCPHHLLPKEGIIQLPEGSSHIKVLRVEPDMRATLSTDRNRRINSIMDNLKFSVLESTTNLEDVWEEIGLSEQQRDQRNKTVESHIQQLLSEMFVEEEQLKNQLRLKTKEYQEELGQLCTDLNMPPKNIPTNLTLLQLENRLRSDVDTLNKEKHDRLKSFKRIRIDEEALCSRLDMPQHELDFAGCPTLDQLRELEQNVKFLKNEKMTRLQLFSKIEKSIKQLWTDLDSEPITELEHMLCDPNAEDTFILSKENLDRMQELQTKLEEEHTDLLQQIEDLKAKVKSLWGRLDIKKKERDGFADIFKSNTPKAAKQLIKELVRLEEMKREHMQKFIESIRGELTGWWDKCYFGEERRQLFQAFCSDIFTEETLAEHESQVKTVKTYYEDNRDLFKLVEKRQTLWKKKVEFENRSADSRRLNNRGGALLKEEKMRKAVEKELPKVEAELRKIIIAWERDNEMYFMFKESRYVDYIEIQRNEYKETQKEKKEEKHRAKQVELDKESKFGASSSKRKIPGTPSKSKMAKMDTTRGTPAHHSRFVHSSLYLSPRPRATPSKENKTITKTTNMTTSLKKAIKKKTTKIQNEARRKSLKRRSNRLAQSKPKVLSEQTNNLEISNIVSGSMFKTSSTNISLCSYHDFSKSVDTPFTRSSFLGDHQHTPVMQSSGLSKASAGSDKRSSSRLTNNKSMAEHTSKVLNV